MDDHRANFLIVIKSNYESNQIQLNTIWLYKFIAARLFRNQCLSFLKSIIVIPRIIGLIKQEFQMCGLYDYDLHDDKFLRVKIFIKKFIHTY